MSSRKQITAVAAVISAAAGNAAYAEPYVGLSAGVGFAQKIRSVQGDENTNYPDPSGGPAPDGALFPKSLISDFNLKTSPNVGIRAGYWSNQHPSLGVELHAVYSRPDFRRQNVTVSNPGFAAATGQESSPETEEETFTDPETLTDQESLTGRQSFTKNQLKARIDQYMVSLNGMYRYRSNEGFSPYIGVGPALFFRHITGTGYSGATVDQSTGEIIDPGAPGPKLKENKINWGINFQTGVEYAVSNEWGVGVGYRFNWANTTMDNFRSLSKTSGDYSAHAAELSILRHF